MTAVEIILIVVAAVFVVGVAVWQIIRKLRGKSGCGCSDCAGCKACSRAKKDEKKSQSNV